jgi:VanZ family protein
LRPDEATHRLHARLLLTVVVLVIYGSLFPFHYQPHDPAWADLGRLVRLGEASYSRSDMIGNGLLFLPYGMLMVSPLLRGRVGLGLLGGVLLAVAVQYLQFWFPDRDPSGLDAALNVAGMLLGWALGRLGSPVLGRWQASALVRPHFALVTTGLMLLWLADRWFPLVPTLDLQNVKNGLKPLLDWSAISKLDVLRHLAGWLVFLRLTRYSILQRLGTTSWILLSVLIVMAEPLFMDNSVGPDNLVGLALALLLSPLLRSGPGSLAVITLVLVGAITASALAPFRFVWAGGFQWVPFAGSLSGDPLAAIPPLIEKLYWYGSLVFFARYLGVSHRSTWLSVAGLLLSLEVVQMWLPGRSPEITDPLLALALAWAFKPVFERARQAASASRGG